MDSLSPSDIAVVSRGDDRKILEGACKGIEGEVVVSRMRAGSST